MSAHALPAAAPAPAQRAGRRTALLALVCAVGGALALLAVIGLVRLATGAGDPSAARSFTAPGNAFQVTVPSGWSALSGERLASVPGDPVAVLRRADGRGLVVVRAIPALKGDLRAVAANLTAQLEKRIAGFRLVSARLGNVRAGGAFLYTFVRGSGATAQSLAITTVRGKTYRIDSIVRAGSPAAAREAGTLVRSFGP